jgi:hypothetical protein
VTLESSGLTSRECAVAAIADTYEIEDVAAEIIRIATDAPTDRNAE